MNEFAKVPPTKVIYVYKVWQSKYDEMLSLWVNFKEDHDNIVDDIKSSVSGDKLLISLLLMQDIWMCLLFFLLKGCL